MNRAWIVLSVTPDKPTTAALQWPDLELPHLVNAVWLLEDYARNPSRHVAHPGEFVFNGTVYPATLQIALIQFADADVSLELHGEKLKPFHAVAAAFTLRNSATQPVLQQAVVQALAAMQQAQRQVLNGDEAEIVKRIIVPGRGN
jgi:hypothetical protein